MLLFSQASPIYGEKKGEFKKGFVEQDVFWKQILRSRWHLLLVVALHNLKIFQSGSLAIHPIPGRHQSTSCNKIFARFPFLLCPYLWPDMSVTYIIACPSSFSWTFLVQAAQRDSCSLYCFHSKRDADSCLAYNLPDAEQPLIPKQGSSVLWSLDTPGMQIPASKNNSSLSAQQSGLPQLLKMPTKDTPALVQKEINKRPPERTIFRW